MQYNIRQQALQSHAHLFAALAALVHPGLYGRDADQDGTAYTPGFRVIALRRFHLVVQQCMEAQRSRRFGPVRYATPWVAAASPAGMSSWSSCSS